MCMVTNPFSRKLNKCHHAKCIKLSTFPKKFFFGNILIYATFKINVCSCFFLLVIMSFWGMFFRWIVSFMLYKPCWERRFCLCYIYAGMWLIPSVPEDKIVSRYQRSLGLLIEAIQFTNRAYIFDNSTHEHIWLAEITNGHLLEIKTDQVPAWLKKALGSKFNIGNAWWCTAWGVKSRYVRFKILKSVGCSIAPQARNYTSNN